MNDNTLIGKVPDDSIYIKNQLVKMQRREFVVRYGAIIFFAVLLIANLIFTRNFAQWDTITNIISQSTRVTLIALAMTLVIGSGGIDISVGATMCFSATIMGILFVNGAPIWLGCLVGVLVGVACGLFNGIIIAVFKLQPIVVTLATMLAFRGIALWIMDGKQVMIADASVREMLKPIAQLKINDVLPISLIYVAVAVFIFYILAQKTMFGRHIEAMGDNRSAARLSGINTTMITIIVYTVAALMAGLAGAYDVSRTLNVEPNAVGNLIEMDCIAAVAIGGTSIQGGKPMILGTLFGAWILQIISIMVVMLSMRAEWAMVIKAALIIIVILVSRDRSGK